MQADEQNVGSQAPTDRALGQIGRCLRQGCVICIEHTPAMAPRFTPWQVWGQSSCYNGDSLKIYREIEHCRTSHADHHIRLNIEDYSCHSRFSFVVHSPPGRG
ncbi:MAG: ribulose bisphosphate carboxylase small subunit [Gammaproteobacteria bacterium]|nr:ribulose bisphosphate carboxylase small subunit [Gammaproteobacteria bacterium]